MDPKELKALLKEAKDSLKSKDYATTMKNCKTILKKEPQHYQANLYLGTALKEQGKWQQAIESYKKATSIDPNQVYAWQGIILTYEKQGIKNHSDLLDAYKRVATFFETDDKAKYIESTKKLANVLISQEDKKGALKVVTRLSKSAGVDLEIARMIEMLLQGTVYNTRTPEHNELYTSALETIVNDAPQPTEDTFKRYLTQLNRSGDYNEVIRQALSMRAKWNTYHSPMEWLCRYYIEGRLNTAALSAMGPFDIITDKLFKLHPSSNFGHFARGKFLIDSGHNMSDGFMFIRTGLESSYNWHALSALICGRIEFGDFEGAVEDCNSGLRELAKDADCCKQLRLYCAEAWVWLNFDKATELLENIKDEVKEDKKSLHKWNLLKLRLLSKQMDFDGLRKFIPIVESLNVHGWILDFYKVILNVDLDKNNCEELTKAVDTHLASKPENFQLHLEAAILLFNLKFFEASADILVNLTKNKLGSSRPLPWKYLGQLYSLQENVELASKCYRKAYKLSPSGDVGALLSDTYFTLGETEKNRDLLIQATKSFIKSKSKWAWLRLGILHLHDGSANDAVTSFQAAIRADTTDCNVWESLADAYFLRGSYSASLNTYKKALSLGADPLYPKLKIGVVYQCLGHHDESKKTLKGLLDEFPDNVTPVLVELARTHCLIAQEMTLENFDIRAQAAVEDTLAYAVLAILHSSKRILLPWKIIGESPLILANLAEDTLIKIPTFILGENIKQFDVSSKKTVEDLEYKHVTLEKLRDVGIQAFLECTRVIEAQQDSSFSKGMMGYIYHQLGLLYFNRARATDMKPSSDTFRKAMICVKKAIASNQQHYIYWNTLGVIANFTGNDELSQHAFIKSLEVESNNVVAWCNLGMLYFKHGKELLAHKAFNKAQSVSPLYSYSWIGQGLVAEILQPKEAPDLFRHAAHLEPTNLAASCYADWVCRLLLKQVRFSDIDFWFCIIRVDALMIVNDLITRVEARCRTPTMYNMKGIVAALNGFHNTALESFTTALELASKASLSESLSSEEINKILLNKITMLVKLQKYEEAVEAFSTIENLDYVGFAVGALTMGKLGYLDQSEKLYIQLLDTLTDSTSEEVEKDKVNATLALGLIYSEMKGPEAACNLLLQDYMAESPHALLALSAIGIVNNDADFVSNVLTHLDKFKNNEEILADIGLVKSCFNIMNGNSKQGVQELLKLVHIYPQNARLWSVLSQIVFRHEFDSIPSSTFRKITLTALKLSNLKIKRSQDSITSKSSAMISLCYLMENDWKNAISTALRGIKSYPEERENWVVLACAYWFQFTETRSPMDYHKAVQLLQKELYLCRIHQRATEWATAFLQLVKKYDHK